MPTTLRDLIREAERGKVDVVPLAIFWDDTRPRKTPPTREEILAAGRLGLRFSYRWAIYEGRNQAMISDGGLTVGSFRLSPDQMQARTDWRLETPEGDPVPWSELEGER